MILALVLLYGLGGGSLGGVVELFSRYWLNRGLYCQKESCLRFCSRLQILNEPVDAYTLRHESPAVCDLVLFAAECCCGNHLAPAADQTDRAGLLRWTAALSDDRPVVHNPAITGLRRYGSTALPELSVLARDSRADLRCAWR